MNIYEFAENNEVYHSKDLIDADTIADIERGAGLSFGPELTEYVLKYGYLAYKHIELYGINAVQKNESDMVKQSIYLHSYFPKTVGYIALENMGDGDYVLVSPDDEVVEFSSEEDLIKETRLKLFDYIVKRFQSAD